MRPAASCKVESAQHAHVVDACNVEAQAGLLLRRGRKGGACDHMREGGAVRGREARPARLVANVANRPPWLLVVRDSNGATFGGFASELATGAFFFSGFLPFFTESSLPIAPAARWCW